MDPRCHVISLPSSRRDKPYIRWTGQSCPSHDQNHTTATRALFIYSNTPTTASAVSRERENYHLHCRNLNTPRPGNPLFLRKEPCNIFTNEALHHTTARSKSYDRNARPLYLFQYTHNGIRRLERARELSFVLSEPQHAPRGDPRFLRKEPCNILQKRPCISPKGSYRDRNSPCQQWRTHSF